MEHIVNPNRLNYTAQSTDSAGDTIRISVPDFHVDECCISYQYSSGKPHHEPALTSLFSVHYNKNKPVRVKVAEVTQFSAVAGFPSARGSSISVSTSDGWRTLPRLTVAEFIQVSLQNKRWQEFSPGSFRPRGER